MSPMMFSMKIQLIPQPLNKSPWIIKSLIQPQPLAPPSNKCFNICKPWWRLCIWKSAMVVDVVEEFDKDTMGVVIYQVVVREFWHSIFGTMEFSIIKDLNSEPLQRGIKSLLLKTIVWEAGTSILSTTDNWGRHLLLILIIQKII